MTKHALIFTLVVAASFSCRSLTSDLLLRDEPEPELNCEGGERYCKTLTNSRFDSLAADVAIAGETQKVVKFVLDRRNRNFPELYFFNTRLREYHHSFVTQDLGVNIRLDTFNKNYGGDGSQRDWNMGSLIKHSVTTADGTTRQRLLMEIWNGDELSGEYLEDLYRRVRDASTQIDLPYLFHPLSTAQEQEAERSNAIEYITSSQLYADREFISLNPGEAVGTVTIIDNNTTTTSGPCLDHTRIAVFRRVPNDLGLVAGVVTEEFQTPLSHVNVKSVNRGTINLSMRNGIEKLRQYEGKAVRIRLSQNDFNIELLDQSTAAETIAQFWSQRRPRVVDNPVADLNSEYSQDFVKLGDYFADPRHNQRSRYGGHRIPRLNDHTRLVRIVGAKATNLGVLKLIENSSPAFQATAVTVPETLGVPFDYFELFMNQTIADPERPGATITLMQAITNIMARAGFLEGDLHSVCTAKPHLEAIRKLILDAEIPAELMDRFKDYIYGRSNGEEPGENFKNSPIHISQKVPRIRLRSSTNSEDLEGFTGAGLYNSEGIKLFKNRDEGGYSDEPRSWNKIAKSLAEGIASIYSSVWNDRAFEEREWFGINRQKHLQIKVGIAVHRAFPGLGINGIQGELGNGVAISQDIYDASRPYHVYINGQHFDLAVTNPPTVEELAEYNIPPDAEYRTEELLVTTLLADPDEDRRPDSWKKWSYNVNGRSSVLGGKKVLEDNPDESGNLSQMEVRRLGSAVKIVSDSFAEFSGRRPDNYVIDTEWKVDGPDRQLYLKQARPYENRQDHGADRAGFVRQAQPVRLGPMVEAP